MTLELGVVVLRGEEQKTEQGKKMELPKAAELLLSSSRAGTMKRRRLGNAGYDECYVSAHCMRAAA